MTKLLKTLAISVLCFAVMSVAAFAAKNITANSDGTFPASYADGTEGQYYALVVVEGIYTENQTPAISEDTVLHIDQVTAGASGASFDNFVPRNNKPATVYVGGSNLDDGPVILGYINAEEPVKEYKVSVAVTADSDAAATVKLVADGVEVTAFYDEAAGKYVATVAEGTYKLTVNVPKHLSYTVNALTVAADVEKAVALYGGDFDGDGAIDAYDLGKITTYFGEANEEFDIDGDGAIDAYDLGKVTTYFGETSVVE